MADDGSGHGSEAGREVGVGPWPSDWALPTGEEYDPELLRAGDRRNVEDRYRYWKQSAIIADLDTRRLPMHIAIENWTHDFNIGSVVRTANAFNVGAFHIVGKRRWNRRGAMVTDRYQHEHLHPNIESLVGFAREHGLEIYAVDNVDGAVPIEQTPPPRDVILLFGAEGPGLSEEALAAADGAVFISQFGSTRSINAGAAAAVAMHTWMLAHEHDWRPPYG